MSYKLAQLNLPSKAKKVQTLSDVFISQPDSTKESLAGKLFILIEINKASNNALKLINYLFQQINNNYYQSDKIILRERISTLKPEHIFETALAKTNKDLEKFIKQEKIKIPFSSINISVGLIYQQNLHFTTTGKNRILLWTKVNNKYKISDLGKAGKESSDKQSKQKYFNSVISGELPPKSFIFISNEALPEYITEKKLSDIVSTLPPVSAIEQIKNLLQNVNSYVSFQSIIIKITRPSKNIEETTIHTIANSENISQLSATENATEKIMSPSGLFNFKKWFNSSSEQNNVQKTIHPLSISKAIKHSLFALLNGIYYILKLIFSLINLKSCHVLWIKITNLKPVIKLYTKNIIHSILNLSLKKRLLLLVALLSVVMLSINIVKNKKEQVEIVQKEEYQELITEIEKKQHQAEASLLYSNETNAQKLFAEISDLMKRLPQITEEQQTAYDDFAKRLELQLEKTNRVIRFSEKNIITDFKNINEQAQPNNIFLLPNVNRLYSADPNNKSIYIVDLNNLSTTVAVDTNEAIAKLEYPTIANDESVYYFSTGNVVEISTTESAIKILPINLLGEEKAFVAADTYNGRYYLLNKQESQIYRYARNGNSFSSPYAWIGEAADLTNAIDLSIDGYVYVLKNNGKVIKYLRGKSVEFKLETINPLLSTPTAIYSSPELKYIYILEPNNARLVVYNKSGQFLEQYKNDFLKNAKDFSIDETNKQMYFLAGTEILQTPALHLTEEGE